MWLARFFDPRIGEALRSQRRTLGIGLACSAGSALLQTVTTALIQGTLHSVESGDPRGLVIMAAAVLALYGVRYFLTRGQMYYLSMAANRLTADLRERLFAKLQRLPVTYFNERRAGAVQSVLTNDVNVYQNAVTSVRDAIDGPIKIVGGLCAIFYYQWQLALISLAVVPVMTLFIQRNAQKMKAAQTQVQSDLADLTAMMQEQLQGTRVVKAFGAEESVIGRFDELVERSYSSQMKAAKRVASLKPMVELIGAAALAATVLYCGLLVQARVLTVSNLAAFLFALDVINQGFKSVGSLQQTLAQVRAASDRIHEEILEVPEPLADHEGAREIAKPVGRIEFKNVSFTYPDGTPALDHVSFRIEPGTSLALVGPSGAGKSTIADLLLRFYDPTEGQILFDGVDVRELKTAWYRRQFGVVPQQTFLFAGTIADNLRLGAPQASEEQVLCAVEMAHAEGFIESTPERYGTVLGERGVRLSGGEGQRIAIARALVRDPLVLLLDEATSSLDAVSEKAVAQALEELMRRKTSLVIAHRLSTAARADQILVLRKGQVAETGSHSELVARNGAYAGMYRAFVEGFAGDELG